MSTRGYSDNSRYLSIQVFGALPLPSTHPTQRAAKSHCCACFSFSWLLRVPPLTQTQRNTAHTLSHLPDFSRNWAGFIQSEPKPRNLNINGKTDSTKDNVFAMVPRGWSQRDESFQGFISTSHS